MSPPTWRRCIASPSRSTAWISSRLRSTTSMTIADETVDLSSPGRQHRRCRHASPTSSPLSRAPPAISLRSLLLLELPPRLRLRQSSASTSEPPTPPTPSPTPLLSEANAAISAASASASATVSGTNASTASSASASLLWPLKVAAQTAQAAAESAAAGIVGGGGVDRTWSRL
jgi:hypothetical protein